MRPPTRHNRNSSFVSSNINFIVGFVFSPLILVDTEGRESKKHVEKYQNSKGHTTRVTFGRSAVALPENSHVNSNQPEGAGDWSTEVAASVAASVASSLLKGGTV